MYVGKGGISKEVRLDQDPDLNAMVIRCWHNLILHGVGLNRPVEFQDSVRVNLRIFLKRRFNPSADYG